MLRLSGLSLPLDHEPEALGPAICARLGIPAEALKSFTVYKRGNDARRRNAIVLVYTLDIALADEAEVLERLAGDKDLRPTPDMTYRPPHRAPQGWSGLRPVVVGAGPCGVHAASRPATPARVIPYARNSRRVDRRLAGASDARPLRFCRIVGRHAIVSLPKPLVNQNETVNE